MAKAGEQPIAFARLLELAQQADRQARCRFTPFLSPAEAELALAAGRRAGMETELRGGYAGAERQMACYRPADVPPEPFPFAALRVTWPRQDAPAHRDLLGALLGLGMKRDRTGDIALASEAAYLFVDTALAPMVAQSLTEAGRIHLRVEIAEPPAALDTQAGEELYVTVQSPRLDAVVADGFHLARGDAAELILAGAVKLRHNPTLRPDARVEAGDAISVRGYGRLRIDAIGDPTRKGRLPVRLTRYGAAR